MADSEYSEVFRVTDGDCISAIDSSLPSVLGTYVIVKWMEIVSAKLVQAELDEAHISVGRAISIEHDLMVPNGEDVEIVSSMHSREKRTVRCAVAAKSNGKTVATASHERVIIPVRLLGRVLGT